MKPISRLRMRARSESFSDSCRLPVEPVSALARRVQQPEQREQRRLAATRRPGDRHVLPVRDLEVHARERVRLDLVGEKDLRDAVELDDRMTVRAHVVASPHFNRTLSCASHALMSERITLSPGFKPSRISTVLTELFPRRTCTRTASSPSSPTPEEADQALSWPKAGRPT